MVVVNDSKLKFTLEKQYKKAKIVLGDLTNENSIKNLISTCRNIFPIVDMLFHIDFIECAIARNQDHPNSELIRSNYLKLTKGVLPKMNTSSQTTLILSTLMDSYESKRSNRFGKREQKKIHKEYISSLDKEEVQIFSFPIEKSKAGSDPQKTVEKFIYNLKHDRLKNENQDLKTKFSFKSKKISNFFSKIQN